MFGLFSGFEYSYDMEIIVVVGLQIMEISFENKTKVAGDKIILLRPQMPKPRIQTLLEDNNLDVRISG